LNDKKCETKSLYFTPRLIKQLAGVWEHPLTIVEAPMGYGKTTAVKHFLSSAEADMLWLKVYDDSIDNFWDAFTRLCGELNDGLSARLAKIGVPDDDLSLRETLQLLGSLVLSKKSVLVIDDYHLIDSPKIGRFIAAFAENEIENLSIVLTGRYIKFQKLEELSLKGLLHHITQETFALTSKEIAKYYRACGVSINEKQARQLYSTTEGWISALYLMLLSFIEYGVLEPPDSIYKLIGKIVYNPLSAPLKELMMILSVFDSFTLEQAIFMWGHHDAKKMLNEIVTENTFVYCEGRSKIYQIHSIFREYLSEALEERGTRFKNELYRKAAEWYMANRDYTVARKFWYACKDFESIFESIEAEKAKHFTKQNMKVLQKYLDECPLEIRKRHHYALLILLFHFILHNENELLIKVFEEVSRNIKDDDCLSAGARNKLLGEIELLHGGSAFNDLRKMVFHFENAWAMLGEPTSIYDVESDWMHGSPSVLYLYYRESGKLQENLADLKAGLLCYKKLARGNGSGGGDLMEAECHYYSGNFVNAEIFLNKAIRKAHQEDQWDIELAAMFLQMRIDLMKGSFESMFRIMSNMREAMAERVEYQYLHHVELCEMFFYSHLDQKYKIPETLGRPQNGDIRLLHPSYAMFNIIYGRVLLINEQYTELIGSAEYFLETASFYPNMLGVIYTYIYLAAANLKIHRAKEAHENLKKAMDIAMPDRLLMPFVENSDYIETLIRELTMYGAYQKEAVHILELYEVYGAAKEKIKKIYFPDENRALTSRENEIASLAAKGLTNKEIADKLFISPNTVKFTLKSVFSKLSITSRALLKQHFEDS
jgi:LuxR family maltose regulon positive regulatory protein